MNAGKSLVAVVWILCISSFLMPADWNAASLGRMLFWGMLVVHAIECVAFRSTLKAAPAPLSNHVVKTMVFGLFHLREIRGTASAPGEGA